MEPEKKHPACFNGSKDYELWLDNPYVKMHPTPAQHCTDCLPSFKMRMLKAGRCEHPETVFSFEPSRYEGEDGVEICGHWAQHDPQKFQVVRFVKPRGRPPKPKKYEPDPAQAESYWQRQERLMRERMNFGR